MPRYSDLRPNPGQGRRLAHRYRFSGKPTPCFLRCARRRGEILSAEMQNVVVTRVPCSGPPSRSRNLVERLMVRFPYLYRRLTAFAQRRLPNPRSRLRRAILRRESISAYAAFNRRDFELMLVRYAPDVEFEFDPGLQTLDLSGTFRGHQEILDGLDQLVPSPEIVLLLSTSIRRRRSVRT
jgi:hypothetical protein